MALLLKLNQQAATAEAAIVPRMKSARLGDADLGTIVYVWLGDAQSGRGALHSRTTLTSWSEITVPQDRDPTKRKHALRLEVAVVQGDIVRPLSTDDLGPYRFVEGADGIASLGRIQRGRDDRIIRLTSAEADVLAERFRQ